LRVWGSGLYYEDPERWSRPRRRRPPAARVGGATCVAEVCAPPLAAKPGCPLQRPPSRVLCPKDVKSPRLMSPRRGSCLGGVNPRGQTIVVYTVRLSFGEIPWFDEKGEIRRCDWLKGTHSLVIHTGHIQKNAFPDQSQRRISPFLSNHGISPNDSVNYSLTVVDPFPPAPTCSSQSF